MQTVTTAAVYYLSHINKNKHTIVKPVLCSVCPGTIHHITNKNTKMRESRHKVSDTHAEKDGVHGH